MTTQEFFMSPRNDFYYVKDSLVWGELFSTPIPKDPDDPDLGDIFFPYYFSVKEVYLDVPGLVGMKKVLSSKSVFFRVSEKHRNNVFLALDNFLRKFNKKFSVIYVFIPHHEEVEPKEEFWPTNISFDSPVSLNIDKEKEMFSIQLEKDYFLELYEYIFNEKYEESENSMYTLKFPFSNFGGAIFD